MPARRHLLASLFDPRSIAVVGASAAPGKAGHELVLALRDFPGRLYLVNPRAPEILGIKAHPRVVDIPGEVDLAMLAVPAEAVPEALRDCARAGARAAIVFAGGFAETGEAGVRLQAEVAELARQAGIRLLGPNTSGYVNPPANIRCSFVPGMATVPVGNIAVVAQSGGVNHALALLAENQGLGLRLGIGLGNAIDVGFAEVLEYLAEDADTRAIALHLEGVGDGRQLVEAVAAVTRRVPVVALKVGRSDVGDFARSHTGNLASGWALTRAALTQAGAVVVDDITELLDAASALAASRLSPRGAPGVGVVTAQAGPGLLIADTLRSAGVPVPALSGGTVGRLQELLPPLTYQLNPVDTGRPGATFPEVLIAVGQDPAVDALVVYALQEPDALDAVAALHAARAAAEVPLLFATGGPRAQLDALVAGLRAEHIPVYPAPERAARAARALVVDARAAYRRQRAVAPSPPRQRPPRLGPGSLDENAAKSVLAAIGLRTPFRRACSTRDEAREAFAERAGPVVVKVLDAAISHKSEVGGVHVGVDTGPELERALTAIDRLAPDGQARYLVEEMVPAGLELIVGGKRDRSFGPVVLVGLGGVAAEVLGDVAVRLAPLSREDATEMLDELAGRRLLEGYRGEHGADREELVEVLLAVSRLFVDHPEIQELDINPLRAAPDGLIALDALLILDE